MKTDWLALIGVFALVTVVVLWVWLIAEGAL